MHDAALMAAGIPLRYEAVDVEPLQFDATVLALRKERAAGNVTVPHKERMFAACDSLAPLAKRVGAVNVFSALMTRAISLGQQRRRRIQPRGRVACWARAARPFGGSDRCGRFGRRGARRGRALARMLGACLQPDA